MNSAVQKIPQLALLHHDKAVNFVCKTMEDVEHERLDHQVLEQPHRHHYFTIIWVEKAEGVHHIDFKSYPLKDNSIYFLSPEQVHYLDIRGKAKGYVLLFTADFLEINGIPRNFLTSLGLFFACDEVTPIRISQQHLAEMKMYVSNIFREFSTGNDLQDESIGSWLKLFLIACNRLKSETIIKNLPFQNNSSRIIRQFKELIDRLYKKFHKVSEYAGEMNITSNYLNEVIKSETGHSAKEVIQDRIMLEAKRLATYSDLQLKEISFELGFEDPAHFSKFFKNLSATDFSSFREQIRKKYL